MIWIEIIVRVAALGCAVVLGFACGTATPGQDDSGTETASDPGTGGTDPTSSPETTTEATSTSESTGGGDACDDATDAESCERAGCRWFTVRDVDDSESCTEAPSRTLCAPGEPSAKPLPTTYVDPEGGGFVVASYVENECEPGWHPIGWEECDEASVPKCACYPLDGSGMYRRDLRRLSECGFPEPCAHYSSHDSQAVDDLPPEDQEAYRCQMTALAGDRPVRVRSTYREGFGSWTWVLYVLGDGRAGLVSSLSGDVADCNGDVGGTSPPQTCTLAPPEYFLDCVDRSCLYPWDWITSCIDESPACP